MPGDVPATGRSPYLLTDDDALRMNAMQSIPLLPPLILLALLLGFAWFMDERRQ
jgi:hypothetical protein